MTLPPNQKQSYFLVGGAGFVGSHFVDYLLGDGHADAVTIFDNFTSGRHWHYAHHKTDPRLKVVAGDAKSIPDLTKAMAGHTTVIHFASNPDIARAVTEPDIDFREGTALTNNVLEAMRLTGTPNILYTSGSGVYGDLHETEAFEDFGPMIPVSTYGASKLAGEALIAAYAHMFDKRACIFRFGNVVGPRQTHGVGYDFLKRLMADPTQLRILGNGTQSKSYVHVEDIVSAVMLAHQKSRGIVNTYNVATGDYITVNEIAQIVLQVLELNPATVRLDYTGGNRGWKGDVPVIRLNTDRIRSLGWLNKRNSAQAIRASVAAMVPDVKEGKI